LACGSFASTYDGVVVVCFTHTVDGVFQVFLRSGGVVKEVACIYTLGAEVGWGEQVEAISEVWSLILSPVLRVDAENGTLGEVELKVRREGEDHSQLTACDLPLDLHLDRRDSDDALVYRVNLNLSQVSAKFDWDRDRDEHR